MAFSFEQEDKDGNKTDLTASNSDEQNLMDAISGMFGDMGVEGIVFVDNSEDDLYG